MSDIHDGRTVLVLGLIWTLILRFQIVMDSTDVEMGMSFRDGLLAWCNRVLNPQVPALLLTLLTVSGHPCKELHGQLARRSCLLRPRKRLKASAH